MPAFADSFAGVIYASSGPFGDVDTYGDFAGIILGGVHQTSPAWIIADPTDAWWTAPAGT